MQYVLIISIFNHENICTSCRYTTCISSTWTSNFWWFRFFFAPRTTSSHSEGNKFEFAFFRRPRALRFTRLLPSMCVWIWKHISIFPHLFSTFTIMFILFSFHTYISYFHSILCSRARCFPFLFIISLVKFLCIVCACRFRFRLLLLLMLIQLWIS